jgi:hypothetical protein
MVLLIVVIPIGLALACSGCYYHDFDLETVDHHSYYGHHHTVDATFYHGDGADE